MSRRSSVSQKDVVLIPFPFSDLRQAKFRPAIVMSNDRYNRRFHDFIAIPLTSNPNTRDHTVVVTRKGNGQGNKYRRKLNSWSFYELQRQIQYKSVWEGIPVRFVDPKRTSQLCPICGDRLQEGRFQHRKLLCINCKKKMDRDVVASLNISYKGWARLIHPRGLSDEAMKWNVDTLQPLILRVDGSQLKIG